MIWNAPFTGSMYDALSSVFVCLLQKTPSLSLSDKEGVYSSKYKPCMQSFYNVLENTIYSLVPQYSPSTK